MQEFFKSNKFKVLLAVAVVIFFFMLRASWTGGLAPMASQVIGFITTPLQKISAQVSYKASEFFDVFVNAKQISKENEELRQKITALNEKLVEYDNFKRENEQLRDYLEIKKQNPEFDFEPAIVISRDPNDRFYSFTIDKGTLSGIEVRDSVITAQGLVGVVTEVGLTYSKVITILDVSLQMGAYVGSTRDVGVLTGRIDIAYDGFTQLSLLDKDTAAQNGDLVLTSGYGSLFPKDLIIGEITQINNEAHGMSRYAVIKPAADIKNVKDVLVIKSFLGETTTDDENTQTQD